MPIAHHVYELQQNLCQKQRSSKAVDTSDRRFSLSHKDKGEIVEVTDELLKKNKENVDESHYDLIRNLGEGSFSKIILVRRLTGDDEGKLYAMKVVKKAVIKIVDIIRINSEKNILANIHHPFIVGLHYGFQTLGDLFLVMDYQQGGPLHTQLSQAVMFTEEDAKFYMAEVVLALEHLHSLGVFYRDLKPDKILLDSDGHVKLADFLLCGKAVCNFYDFGDEEFNLSKFSGLVEYTAPEVFTRSFYSHMADWWSFGVVFYEIIVGFYPFRGTDRNETVQNIKEMKLPMPRCLSPEANSFFRCILNKTPRNRLGYDFNDFSEDLVDSGDDYDAVDEPEAEDKAVSEREGSGGVARVRDHKFFNNICWERLYAKDIKPPYKPTPQDSQPMKQKTNIPRGADAGPSVNNLFRGFSFGVKTTFNYPVEEDSIPREHTRFPAIFVKQFRIKGELGRGSESVYYKCIDKYTGSSYAVKVMAKTMKVASEEVNILQRVGHDHPNIVTLFELFDHGEQVLLVMEIMEGGDLLNYITHEKHHSEKKVAGITHVLIGALEYLHDHGITHRDIHLSNIMFKDKSRAPASLRICNFGFAKQLRAENGLLMTTSYTAKHTASEMRDDHGFEKAWDIWSVGILLCVLVSGRTPFPISEEDDLRSIFARIISGDYNIEVQRNHWEHATDHFVDLISRMLHVNHKERHTATEVLNHPWLKIRHLLPTGPLRRNPQSHNLHLSVNRMMASFRNRKDRKSIVSVQTETSIDGPSASKCKTTKK